MNDLGRVEVADALVRFAMIAGAIVAIVALAG
jgi:hypothetical protein